MYQNTFIKTFSKRIIYNSIHPCHFCLLSYMMSLTFIKNIYIHKKCRTLRVCRDLFFFYLILPKFVIHIMCDMECMHSEQNIFIYLWILNGSISCCVFHGTAGANCLISITLNFHNLSIRYSGKWWEAGILKIICTESFGDPWSKLFQSILFLFA